MQDIGAQFKEPDLCYNQKINTKRTNGILWRNQILKGPKALSLASATYNDTHVIVWRKNVNFINGERLSLAS